MSDVVSNEPPVTGISAEERQWALFAHLSPLVAMWVGYLGFLGPLIVWLIKKDQMPFVNDQGKESLNFQLNIFVLGLLLGLVGIPTVFFTFGLAFLLIGPLALGLVVVSIVMPIIAATKANAGEAYRYPHIIRVIT
jgi:uncharacterized Tic20 family protein